MEGRIEGRDITGDSGSGMILEMLTDPGAILGMGAFGLGGLGMALSRREFLKKAGKAAAAASLPLEGVVKGAASLVPSSTASKLSGVSTPDLKSAMLRLHEQLERSRVRVHSRMEDLWKEKGRWAPKKEFEQYTYKVESLMDSKTEIATELARRGWDTEGLDSHWKSDDPPSFFRIDDDDPDYVEDVFEHFDTAYDELSLANAREWGDLDSIGYYPDHLEPWSAESERLMQLHENTVAEGRTGRGEYYAPPGRGARSNDPPLRPADMDLLLRLMKESQTAGGRHGY
tara:strand:+ start:1697 stop:2554 length:858 start_codon:yes stop_codon:yes gene_type:complete